ncbi:MAG: hypothetical protein DELT_02708 [Desulfovibrio sp.]
MTGLSPFTAFRSFCRLPALRVFAPLFEHRCAACAAPVPAETHFCERLCATCLDKLARRQGGFCTSCGNMTADASAAPSLCSSCLMKQHAGKTSWDAFFFFASYEGFLRDLILRCKAAGELPLALPLGLLLASHPAITGPYDAIIPIPLHQAKLRKRGFNQTLEMAKPLATRLDAPIRPDLLVRAVRTRTQSGLSLEKRKQNMRGAFAANNAVGGLRVLLVDDIATTCATLEEAARSLHKKGAASIDVAVLARTPERAP